MNTNTKKTTKKPGATAATLERQKEQAHRAAFEALCNRYGTGSETYEIDQNDDLRRIVEDLADTTSSEQEIHEALAIESFTEEDRAVVCIEICKTMLWNAESYLENLRSRESDKAAE